MEIKCQKLKEFKKRQTALLQLGMSTDFVLRGGNSWIMACLYMHLRISTQLISVLLSQQTRPDLMIATQY